MTDVKTLTKQEILEKYEPVIGFEIHVELSTAKKMFCACDADWFQKDPNTQVCPVCLGLPGALPVPNKTALEYSIKIAYALGCKINLEQQFDRKHYFYPDLPKGYQITQFYKPVGVNGEVDIMINGKPKKIRLRRVHLEEDTGKLIHEGDNSLVNFNRSGVPLVEIVTEPDFANAAEAKIFLKMLQNLVRRLGVSDADMEKGSMRLEPNISLRKKGEKGLPNYKVEVKNINSFNFAVKAIESEIIRQGNLLENNETPVQETRGFNMSNGKTVSQRRKEIAEDYRYLTEPDIPPIVFTKEQIDEVVKDMPVTPYEQFKQYINMGIDEKISWTFVEDKHLSQLFDSINKQDLKNIGADKVKIAKFIVNKYKQYNFKDKKQVLDAYKKEYSKDDLDANEALEIVKQVIKDNPKAVADYKAGKQNAVQYMIGQFMRTIKRRVDVKPVIEMFKKELDNLGD